jgi:hypothetical protein
VVVRRSCYERVGLFNPSLPFTADWEMWMRAALHFDVGYLIKGLVQYRRHEKQETARFGGLKDIEHGYLAKMMVLNRFQDRIPDVATLRADVLRHYRDAAIGLWEKLRAEGQAEQATECLSFAIQVEGERAASPRAYADWFLELMDELLKRPAAPVSAAISHDVVAQAVASPAESEMLHHARNEVAALRSSLSWRVTAPLRGGYEAVLRLRSLRTRR